MNHNKHGYPLSGLYNAWWNDKLYYRDTIQPSWKGEKFPHVPAKWEPNAVKYMRCY